MILKRIAGILLVIVGASSLLVSLFVLVQVWRLREPVTASLQSSLELISTTLSTSAEGLEIANQSLVAVQSSVTALEGTVQTLGKSIDDSTPMIDSLVVLMGKDLPETVTSAQSSLTAAQDSARVIDAVLRVLTILSPSLYNPRVPLNVALGEVSQSLDGLPKSFQTIQVSLKSTQLNLAVMKSQISLIADQIGQINASLADAEKVITQYQLIVTRMQAATGRVKTHQPAWVDATAVALTFLLFWLGVTQFGVILRGWGMVRYTPRTG